MAKKIMKFFSITLLIIIALGFAFLFGTGIGYQLRTVAAEVILSSQHRNLVKYTFLPKEEIDGILKSIQNPDVENTHDSSLSEKIISAIKDKEEEKTSADELKEIYERRATERQVGEALENNDQELADKLLKEYEEKVKELKKETKLKVEVKTIEGKEADHYYKGQMAIISNPHNVKLSLSQSKQIGAGYGEQVSYIAKREDAILATNASGFVDENGNGTGGTPIGIVISDSKPIADPGGTFAKDFVAAFNSDGLLLTGYYSTDELVALNVRDAAGFKPQLISNGKKMITSGNGGWGYGPRTTIGQKDDGSIVIVVIDGRQTHSVGASMKDVQDLMYEEGVINAMAMDGGSSAIMIYNGKQLTTPSSLNNIPRYVPNAWTVVANEGQEVELYKDGELVDKYTK